MKLKPGLIVFIKSSDNKNRGQYNLLKGSASFGGYFKRDSRYTSEQCTPKTGLRRVLTVIDNAILTKKNNV